MVLIPQAIDALLKVINRICNFDILQSTAPRMFFTFFLCGTWQRWTTKDAINFLEEVRMVHSKGKIWQSIKAFIWLLHFMGFYVMCYQMPCCRSEEVVRFFILSWFISSSIHRNTPHPEGVHERLTQQSSLLYLFKQLTIDHMHTMFHFPPGVQQNKYQHWKTRSYAKLAPFFPIIEIKVGGHGSLFSQGAIHFPWKPGNKTCSCVIMCHVLPLFCCCSVWFAIICLS